ncbi:MAG TPA: peptidase T [Ferruginibacter sp.]|nr:peptidase T [Ferruginibacter sp.]
MINIDRGALIERFMRYVRVDTQSDPNSTTFPSTAKQKDLSKLLYKELGKLVKQVHMDEHGYVYAVIPSNSIKKNIPVICFCSHVDTAPDCSGTHVKPILHRYTGKDIVFPDDPSLVLSAVDSPYLNEHLEEEIITASGLTLLGADDKSGVAVIMQAVQYLVENNVVHGEISIVFTPDEEVGKGTSKIDMKRIGAQYGYTLDGGERGSLEDETFSADGATITVYGVSAHPGYAKDKLVNAIKIAGEIAAVLPKKEWCPESTQKREGFVHPVAINGIAEKSTLTFILRDFNAADLPLHHKRLKEIAENVVRNYPGAYIEYQSQEQYRNMKQVLDKVPWVVEFAAEAIKRTGLSVKKESIRGGTDGSKLSYMGLPCPNIFTGMQNIHSRLEWIAVNDMVKAAETLVHLSMIWEEKGNAGSG